MDGVIFVMRYNLTYTHIYTRGGNNKHLYDYQNVFLTYVNLPYLMKTSPPTPPPPPHHPLSFWCLKMHTISCNSHVVVMDTEKKKGAEKRKRKHHLCP